MLATDLLVNGLLRFQEGDKKFRIERVLKIDIPEEEISTIDILDRKAMPKKVFPHFLEELFSSGEVELWEDDPFIHFLKSEDEIPEKYRKNRDAAWGVIEELVQNPLIFDPKARGQLVLAREAALRSSGSNVTKTSIYKYLRRYWQGGQVPNALLPYWHRSGALSPTRSAGAKKRGRPRIYGAEAGVNVSEGSIALQQLEKGYEKYINKRNAFTFQDAYDGTISDFFSDLPEAEHPTKAQFTHWMHKKVPADVIAKFTLGERGYDMEGRPRSGQATDISLGPGSPFLVDETPGDIRLVSKTTREDIGRANIIFIIDVFSWLITGVSVTLDAPSWMTAVAALENTVTDKVEYCQQYGIEIAEEEWPAKYLPKWIYADRGVFKSYNSDKLSGPPLHIPVSNNPPRRPDLKGMIERTHKLLKDFLIKEIPGAILKKDDERFEIDATIDIDQLRKVVIRYIIYHNKNFIFRKFAISEAIVVDRIKPHPINLWNWGRKNLLGHLRPMKPEVLRANLLPEGKAKVTEDGIRYRNLYYTSETFRKENWALKAKRDGPWEISVRFHPNSTGEIYFRPSKNSALETGTLSERSHAFLNLSWKAVDSYFRFLGETKRNAENKSRKSKQLLNAEVKEIVKEARKLKKGAQGTPSRKATKETITENRRTEADRDRQETILMLQPSRSKPNIPLNTSSEVDDDYVPAPESNQSTLKALREATEEFYGEDDA